MCKISCKYYKLFVSIKISSVKSVDYLKSPTYSYKCVGYSFHIPKTELLKMPQSSFTNNATTLCYGATFAETNIENDTLVFLAFMSEKKCDSVVNTQVL